MRSKTFSQYSAASPGIPGGATTPRMERTMGMPYPASCVDEASRHVHAAARAAVHDEFDRPGRLEPLSRRWAGRDSGG
jgi:hypothetical protein